MVYHLHKDPIIQNSTYSILELVKLDTEIGLISPAHLWLVASFN